MSEPLAKRDDSATERETPSRRESGLRRKVVEESAQRGAWPAMTDQDSIPTEPANDVPKPPSLPAPPVEHPIPTLDMPPASVEDVRDTIPSPPPEREHD
jgi:hypothetical protein